MAYTEYTAIAARNPRDLTTFMAEAIADGWQPYGPPTNDDNGLLIQLVVKGTANGGGNYTPPNAAAGTRGLVLMGAAVTDATDDTDVVAQFNALLASLRTAGSIAT